MLSVGFQVVALWASLLQSAATAPLRTGIAARQLTEQDIAALELVLRPEKPWLLNGDHAQYGLNDTQRVPVSYVARFRQSEAYPVTLSSIGT